jgi:hypothetical protein
VELTPEPDPAAPVFGVVKYQDRVAALDPLPLAAAPGVEPLEATAPPPAPRPVHQHSVRTDEREKTLDLTRHRRSSTQC